jgi:TPP-dependent pyruvate/acetoin dehydrogenase alpha subunit
MLLIRAFEERLDHLFADGLLRGTTHFCIGQEASAVGACSALQPQDYVTSTHRGHGHFLARGGDPRRMLAEIFGKSGGYCQGKGGTQHMASMEIGFLGSNGITGGGIPIATGAALSSKLRHTGSVALCFFGDGAANQGVFHESLNMAGLWKLPVIYVCENNLYAMGTSTTQAFAVPDVAARAAIYGMPGIRIDGNDLLSVRDAAHQAAVRARSGEGPSLLEVCTYRSLGHSRSDARHYRTRGEEADWRSRDPIPLWRDHLRSIGFLTDDDDRAVRQGVESLMDEAVEYSKTSPFLSAEAASTGVYR